MQQRAARTASERARTAPSETDAKAAANGPKGKVRGRAPEHSTGEGEGEGEGRGAAARPAQTEAGDSRPSRGTRGIRGRMEGTATGEAPARPLAAAPGAASASAGAPSASADGTTAAKKRRGRRGPPLGERRNVLDAACSLYGTTLAASRISLKGGRKVAYLLRSGALSGAKCFKYAADGSLCCVPQGVTVLFEAQSAAWVCSVDYPAAAVLNDEHAAAPSAHQAHYQFRRVHADGSLSDVLGVGVDNPSAGFREALLASFGADADATARPNGRLLVGIMYEEMQAALLERISLDADSRADREVQNLCAMWCTALENAAASRAGRADARQHSPDSSALKRRLADDGPQEQVPRARVHVSSPPLQDEAAQPQHYAHHVAHQQPRPQHMYVAPLYAQHWTTSPVHVSRVLPLLNHVGAHAAQQLLPQHYQDVHAHAHSHGPPPLTTGHMPFAGATLAALMGRQPLLQPRPPQVSVGVPGPYVLHQLPTSAYRVNTRGDTSVIDALQASKRVCR